MAKRLRRQRTATGPLLSVIVPIYNVEDYLDECLHSIRAQRYRSIEIIVVDDGSPDRSHDLAVRQQRKDPRIRIVRRPNGGLSAARNTGVEAARGDFLTFVDSDDTVTPDGFAAAMDSLLRTGSDVAVLGYRRLRDGKPGKPARWIRELHAREREATTLAASPEVMVNATAWAKVINHGFYTRTGLGFVEGIIYEDQAFTAHMYAAAESIDVLATVGYNWRVNETSMSQGQVTVPNLTARLDAAEDSLANLAEHPQAQTDRVLQLLRHNIPNSLLKLERADDDYLAVLIDRLPRLLDRAPADRFAAEIPAQYRVLCELIRLGEHRRIWDYVRAEGMQPEMHPSGPERDGFSVYLPGWQRDPILAAAYVLTSGQTKFKAKIVRARRLGPGEFALDVRAWFQNVGGAAELDATVTADGTALAVDAARNGDDAIVSSRQDAQRRYAGSGWTLTVRHESARLPGTLAIGLSAVAEGFVGERVFASFKTARIRSRWPRRL